MILWVANNGDANAKPRGDRAFRHALGRVVRAFGVNVGPQLFQERFDVGFGEEHDVVYAAEGRHELRARAFIEDRPAGSLQVADAGIDVHANDQNIAFAARAFEITNMPDVKHIEAAVRQNDALAAALVFRESLAERITGNDLGRGLAHDSAGGSRGFAANGVEKFLARDCSRAALHYH